MQQQQNYQKHELYGLTSQVRRSVESVESYITKLKEMSFLPQRTDKEIIGQMLKR